MIREGTRQTYTATFSRFDTWIRGRRRRYAHHMLLFLNVCDGRGAQMTDHLWFPDNGTWKRLRSELTEGQRVAFIARSKPYWKGYHDARRMDWKLANPTDVRLVDFRDPKQPLLF